MLDSNIKQQLESYLQNLTNAVELEIFLNNDEKSKELDSLAISIDTLSDHIQLTKIFVESDKTIKERAPSLVIRSKKTGNEIRFAGIPMGHEFTSLVLALLHSGGHPIKISSELIEQVKNLSGEYYFETYIQLSCQTCPEVVQALNMMAAINPNIHHVMIDGALFPDEVAQRDIMAVPTVYLNGELFSQGRINLEKILLKVDSNLATQSLERFNQKEPFDLLVIGAGPAGAASAIYSARKGIRTGLVTERMGGQVADTVGIENFISVKATEGPKLVSALEEHVREYNVDIMENQQVTQLHTPQTNHEYASVTLANGAQLYSRSILLSTGARWRELNVPGEQEYRGKGVAYCPHCDGPLFKNKRVSVIGGGNSGIEAAIDLAGIVEHVTVLEFSDKLLADDVLQKKAESMNNIDIILMAQTTEVLGDGNKVTGLAYLDRNTQKSHQIDLEGIFVQIGLVPNTDFLKNTDIELSNRGEIITNAKGETNIPGIFAAGDVTNSPYKQIIIAMGDGSNAALGAFDYLIRTPEPVSKQNEAAA